MDVTYRDLNYSCEEDRCLLARWYNDPETRHLHTLFQDETGLSHVFVADDFLPERQGPPGGDSDMELMVLVEGRPIGEARMQMDVPKLITKEANTAWLSLAIHEASLRRRGLGDRIASHLESLAYAAGAERIEVGIFEYNEPSLRFFAKRGYREFLRQPNRPWWNGRRWDDIRLLKSLGVKEP